MRIIYKCFPGGKHKVLTMSYDDGREPDKKLINIFNKYGIKGTFHLNSGLVDNKIPAPNDIYGKRIPMSEYKELYKGHEVSCHTVTHPTIERSPMTQVVQEMLEDRKVLESVMGYTVRGLSYPNGSVNEDIKEMLSNVGIEYGRAVDVTHGFKMPRDFREWKATCKHNDPEFLNLADEFINLTKKQYMYMFYVWGHSYEFVRDNNFDVIEKFCEKMSNRDDIWYATNIEIVDYMKACDNLRYSADGSFVYNPNYMSVWVSVDSKIYEIPGGKQVYFEK